METARLVKAWASTLEQTGKLLDGVDDAKMGEIPHEGGKSAAWLLGHLVVAADFAAALAGGPRRHEALDGLCAPDTQPKADRSAYPPKAELLAALRERHAEVERLVTAMPDSAFEAELPMPDFRSMFPTVGDAIFYLLALHEPYHTGQMQSWRRAVGLPAPA